MGKDKLCIEKEMFERMYRKFHDICDKLDEFELADTTNKDRDIDDRRHLHFVPVSENTHKVMNRKTGRFHNLELGLDWVV